MADGYCNSRVVRFSLSGAFEAEYKLPRGAMDVPHSLVLDECLDGLYVADREHSQVHKFSISKTTLQGVLQAVQLHAEWCIDASICCWQQAVDNCQKLSTPMCFLCDSKVMLMVTTNVESSATCGSSKRYWS